LSSEPSFPIVDDVSAMRRIVRDPIEQIGNAGVEAAENGAEAAPQIRVWGAERLGAAEVQAASQAASDPPDLAQVPAPIRPACS
jgi:hypothetical protein